MAFCHGALFLVIENNTVRARDANLNYSCSFGSNYYFGSGWFKSPCGIVSDSAGKIYVADTGNHCIRVFTGI